MPPIWKHTLSHLFVFKYSYNSYNLISYFYQEQELRPWLWIYWVVSMNSEIKQPTQTTQEILILLKYFQYF